jgi:hypothetical protein
MLQKKRLKKPLQDKLQRQLKEAAKNGDMDKLKDLINKGATVDFHVDEKNFEDVLDLAIKNHHEDAALFLMNETTVELSHIFHALEERSFKLAKDLLRKSGETAFTENDYNKIIRLLDLNQPECVDIINLIGIDDRILKEKIIEWVKGKEGVKLEESDLEKITAFPRIYLYNKYAESWDIYNTPLLTAILKDNSETAKELISLDKSRKTINNEIISKELINAGADVDIQGFRGFTALHWACILRLNDLIEFLLQNGADPQVENDFGKKPIEYYIQNISDADVSYSPTKFLSSKMKEKYPPKDSNFTEVESATYTTGFTESGPHFFSTKVRDFSDLYWHIAGIFKNLN